VGRPESDGVLIEKGPRGPVAPGPAVELVAELLIYEAAERLAACLPLPGYPSSLATRHRGHELIVTRRKDRGRRLPRPELWWRTEYGGRGRWNSPHEAGQESPREAQGPENFFPEREGGGYPAVRAPCPIVSRGRGPGLGRQPSKFRRSSGAHCGSLGVTPDHDAWCTGARIPAFHAGTCEME
jgi:hypothetical protein